MGCFSGNIVGRIFFFIQVHNEKRVKELLGVRAFLCIHIDGNRCLNSKLMVISLC